MSKKQDAKRDADAVILDAERKTGRLVGIAATGSIVATVATLVAGLRLLRRGPSVGRVALLAGLALLAASTRSSGLVVVAGAALLALLVPFLHPGGHRLRVAVASSVAVALIVIAIGGIGGATLDIAGRTVLQRVADPRLLTRLRVDRPSDGTDAVEPAPAPRPVGGRRAAR